VINSESVITQKNELLLLVDTIYALNSQISMLPSFSKH